MKIKVKTKINFHQKNVIAVSFNCNATSKDEVKFSELLVFCVFSLRQLFNLGGNPPFTIEIVDLLNDIAFAGIKGDVTFLLANTRPIKPKLDEYHYCKSFVL